MFGQKLSLEPETCQEMLLHAFFDGVPEALLLCGPSLTILSANRAAQALLGVPAAGLVGRSAYELLPAPPPAHGTTHVDWHSRFQRGETSCDIFVSGAVLRDFGAQATGWLLALKSTGPDPRPPEFIGVSSVTRELLEFVSRVAGSPAAVLLMGESGTGKEIIARRLHAMSPRAAAPFVAVNCAALPEDLFESELFGYEKGAFTNADHAKKGLFGFADGGTLFLDEIGELPLTQQAKLLRVLEDHTFRAIGGTRSIAVALCVISATNANLEQAIESRRFRSDLYYRLNTVQIHLPALRERPEDIDPLAGHFLAHFNRIHRRGLRGIHPAARRQLNLYPWPGNVRELRNVIERAVLLECSPWITSSSLCLSSHGRRTMSNIAVLPRESTATPFCLRGSERELIAAALAESHGNQTRAAQLLGVGRFSLRYKMKKLGLL